MAIFEQNVDITSFINITTGGVQVASFADIRDTLIKRMKWVYGNDIDVSSATADGQWLNQIALIINNICQVVQYSFDMLDPASATGSFLDILCSYNNIQRRNITNSVAQLQVKNISGVAQNAVGQLIFTDKNDNTWTWNNPGKDVNGATLNPNTEVNWAVDDVITLTNVKCDTMGPIIAIGTHTDVDWNNYNVDEAGSINQTVEYGKWQVYQQDDAIVGYTQETDEALRSRRIQSLGNQSVSVLSGLEGALLNITGVKDVWVFNNDTASPQTMSDGTVVPGHTVYVCIRYDDTISNATIGGLIYNKLTPGIPTQPYNKGYVLSNPQPTEATFVKDKYYTYADSTYTLADTYDNSETYYNLPYGDNKNFKIAKTSSIIYNVYWKKCLPFPFTNTTFSPSTNTGWIEITLNLLTDNFEFAKDDGTEHHATTTVEKNIVKNILEYVNSVKLGEDLNAASFVTATQKGDILKNNLSTFFATTCNISGQSNGVLDLKNTYPELTENNICFKTTKSSGNIYSPGYVLIKAAS